MPSWVLLNWFFAQHRPQPPSRAMMHRVIGAAWRRNPHVASPPAWPARWNADAALMPRIAAPARQDQRPLDTRCCVGSGGAYVLHPSPPRHGPQGLWPTLSRAACPSLRRAADVCWHHCSATVSRAACPSSRRPGTQRPRAAQFGMARYAPGAAHPPAPEVRSAIKRSSSCLSRGRISS